MKKNGAAWFMAVAVFMAGGLFPLRAEEGGKKAAGGELSAQEKMLQKLAGQMEEILDNQKKQQKQLDEIQKQLENSKSIPFTIEGAPFSRGGEKYDKLRLELKEFGGEQETWDKQKVEDYLQAIVGTCRKMQSFSSSDYPAVAVQMLGPKHLLQVIEFVVRLKKDKKHMNLFIFLEGIEKIVLMGGEQSKKIVADHLADLPELVSVVQKMEWERDLKDQLVAVLSSNDRNVSTWQYAQALASLKDKDTYPLLRDILLVKNNKASVYREVKDLPGFEVEKYVETAWRNCNGFDESSFAGIAAQHGVYDAFESLIESAQKPKGHFFGESPITELYRLTGFAGDGKKYSEWYNKNKEHIFFDPKTQRYVVDMKRAPRGAKEVF